jgi:thioesterase domain-containing protein
MRYGSGLLILVPSSNNNLNSVLFQATYANRVPGEPMFLADPNCHCFDPNKQFVLNPKAWADPAAGPRPLVRLQPRGGRPPLFCVHPGGGTAFCYLPLAFHLGPDQPVYGLQAPGLGGEQAPLARVEDMAAAYVAALRTVQPQGPYRLAGWSFGGMVAFEMARQIMEAGQDVATLLLLDASSPARTAVPPGLDDEQIVRGLAREVAGPPSDGGPDRGGAWLPVEPLLDLARRIRLVPSDAGAQHLTWMLAVFKANLRAATDYRPRPYPGPVTVLCAAGEAPPGDPTLGWGELVTGRLDVREVPGDHFGVVREPFVREIARVVGECLAPEAA